MTADIDTGVHVLSGRIVEARNGRCIVEVDGPPRDSDGEKACARCGLCTPAGQGRLELRASVPKKLEIVPGDRVEVEVRMPGPLRAGLLLYGMPLAAFLGVSLSVWAATGSEGISAFSGFCALGAAFLILMLVERARGGGAVVKRRLGN